MNLRLLSGLIFTFLIVQSASAGTRNCVRDRLRDNLQGALFLHGLNPNFHKTPMVQRAQSVLMQLGEKNPQDVQKKIAAWLSIIEKTHLGRRDEPQVLNRLKEYYYREHVISEKNFPESYFKLQKKISREQGKGDVEISPKQRAQLMQIAIEDQKKSLDPWIEYLTSKDALYPMWAKVWAFNGMTRIEKIDAKTGHVLSRSSKTVAPFIELNREALSLSIEAVEKSLHAKLKGLKYKELESNTALRELVQGGNFGKIYGFFLHALIHNEVDLRVTKGAWVKYPKGSDPKPLVQSLQCKNTGWCTAGESTAKMHLEDGDFYVYYSHDALGRPKDPRIAIRMQNDGTISEVRGIGPSQELDPVIANTEILDQKLKEFGTEGDRYRKRSSDMKLLTHIEKKLDALEELTESELRFLYEIESNIESFGYKKDPRIAEIIGKRDKRKDLSVIFHVKPEEVSLTGEEVLSGTAKVHYGDLNLSNEVRAQYLKLPEVVIGNLNLSRLKSAAGLKLPDRVLGDINLSQLESARGLKFPKVAHGDLDLRGLKSAEELVLPETVHGSLNLSGLTSAKGLVLPKEVRGDTFLRQLASAEGLNLPERMGRGLWLDSLKSAKGLILPQKLHGSLNLDGLQSTAGLRLPKVVHGSLSLNGLTNADGLKLPEMVHGDLDLDSLVSAEGLILHVKIGGSISLRKLKTAKGLNLPEIVRGHLSLNSLVSAEGLKLPQKVGGQLDLSGLKSAKGLELPEVVSRDILLYGLTSDDELVLPAQFVKQVKFNYNLQNAIKKRQNR